MAAKASAVDGLLGLLQKAARVGGDPGEILAKAQAPFSFDQLLNAAVPSVEARQLSAIYRECIVAIGWHSSRLDGKPQMLPDEFRLMCHCVITCRTLRDVIERQAMFFRSRWDRLSTLELTIGDGAATISLDTLRRRKNFGTFLSDLAGTSIFARLYGWLIGVGGHLFSVGMAYGEPYAKEAVSDFFAGELTFGEPVNRIRFPSRFLDMPVVRTPEDLEKLLVEFPFDFLASRPAELRLSDRVRNIYGISLARGDSLPSLEELAAATDLSVSSVRRGLEAEQSSVRQLKDDARRDFAADLLRNARHSIEEVAFRSGFKDVDTFRAAVRRWRGTTPGDWRRSLGELGR